MNASKKLFEMLETIRKQKGKSKSSAALSVDLEPRCYHRFLKEGGGISLQVTARVINSLEEFREELIDELYDASRQLKVMYHFLWRPIVL